jgi:DNA-binding phage protein
VENQKQTLKSCDKQSYSKKSQEMTVKEIQQETGISPSALYRALSEEKN